jgi:hypothetical protein
MWQLLEQWLTAATRSDRSAQRHFKDKAKDTRRLCFRCRGRSASR